MSVPRFADAVPRGLIVSCQAPPGHPCDDPLMLAAFARCAKMAGAVGIRANGPQPISQARARCDLPVIGINKWDFPGFDVRITPTFSAVHDIAIHGPQVIATDGTPRPRPLGEELATLIRRTHEDFGVPVMADIDSVESAEHAVGCGADCVATTLSGYTAETMPGGKTPDGPDMELVALLVKRVKVPVVAEGRFTTPAQVSEALRLGAHAVVVGRALTRPEVIARPFAEAASAALG